MEFLFLRVGNRGWWSRGEGRSRRDVRGGVGRRSVGITVGVLVSVLVLVVVKVIFRTVGGWWNAGVGVGCGVFAFNGARVGRGGEGASGLVRGGVGGV